MDTMKLLLGSSKVMNYISLSSLLLLSLPIFTKCRLFKNENDLQGYLFKRRLPLWCRQLLHGMACILSVLLAVKYRHDMRMAIYASVILVKVVNSFLLDDVQNLYENKYNRLVWLPIYLSICIDSSFLALNDFGIVGCSLVVTSFLAFAFSLVVVCCDFKKRQAVPPTAEYTSGLLNYLTFSYISVPLIDLKLRKDTIEVTDVPELPEHNRCKQIWSSFHGQLTDESTQTSARDEKESKIRIGIARHLFHLVCWEWLEQGFFQLFSSLSLFAAPLALERILWSTTPSGEDSTPPAILPFSLEVAVTLLFLGPICRVVGDGQNFARGRHIGVTTKAALISLVYRKVLRTDSSLLSVEGSGNLSNLISVDATAVQNFFCYSHFLWSSPLEMSLCILLLFQVLGLAAAGGLVTMLLTVPLGLAVGKRLEFHRDKLLIAKDKRVDVVSEVLHGLRVIKLCVWEPNFLKKIYDARSVEMASLRNYLFTNAFMMILWEALPALVATSAFMVHTAVLGRKLSPSMGFTALTLFNELRFPLMVFPEMINDFVQCRISTKRIEQFLRSEETQDLKAITVDDKVNSGTSGITSPMQVIDSEQDRNGDKGQILVENASFGWTFRCEASLSVKEERENEDSDKSSILKNGSANQYMRSSPAHKLRKWGSYYPCNSFFYRYCHTCCWSSGKRPSPLFESLLQNEPDDNGDAQCEAVWYGNEKLACVEWDHEDRSNRSPVFPPTVIVDYTNTVAYRPSMPSTPTPSAKSLLPRDILRDLSLQIPRGGLTVVVGPTGCGKSTLLQGILGECKLLSGNISISVSRIAYVSQTPWIQNATIRDNILFGSVFEPKRYAQVISACALEPDLKTLPGGDLTEIGEKGVNLSGGQQQRVSLARAAYSDCGVILLDDPLSAVDAHVAEHIYKHLICSFLRDRTRLLVSHQVALAVSAASTVLCLDKDGNVLASCHPDDLREQLRKNVSMYQLLESGSMQDLIEGLQATSLSNEGGVNNVIESNTSKPGQILESPLDKFPDEKLNDDSLAIRVSSLGSIQCNDDSIGDGEEAAVAQSAEEGHTDPNHIVKKETMASGNVGFAVYWTYFRASGGLWVAFILVASLVSMSALWVAQSYYLGSWMTCMQSDRKKPWEGDSGHFLALYLISTLFFLVLTGTSAAIQAMAASKASLVIHERLITAVVQAPVAWLEATPVGRIINRFSQDMATTDTDVMNRLMDFMNCLLGGLQVVGVVTLSLPMLLVPLLPIAMLSVFIANKYFKISRDLKRLESVNNSPVFVLLSETLQGIAVIRAFSAQERFFSTLCERVDLMNRCHLYLWICNRWLNARMQLLGAIVSGTAGLFVYWYGNTIGSTAAGLVLVYSLNFSDCLTYLTRAHADCQMNMNSVERILEYCAITPEQYHPKTSDTGPRDGGSGVLQKCCCCRPRTDNAVAVADPLAPRRDTVPSNRGVSQSWPSRGELEFRVVTMRYATADRDVLRGVSFKVPAGAKVGIVGRTGAGKSSLVAALFRTVEPTGGSLLVDGVDVLKLPLNTLRGSLAIVPQTTDEVLWEALRKVHMADYVASMQTIPLTDNTVSATGLSLELDVEAGRLSAPPRLDDKPVLAGGANFSSGQRQLLCLARAAVRRSRVLVLDEATANIDPDTDALIQDTVKKEFEGITVLSIAHRLRTVVTFDLVLVLDAGEVIEFDTPLALLNREESAFRALCDRTGEAETLRRMAEDAVREKSSIDNLSV